MASNTKNVQLGVCSIRFGGKNLGFTKGGVEVDVTTSTHEVNVDQFGETAINEYIMGRSVKVKAPLAETTLENLLNTMPGAQMVSDGAYATGTLTVDANPGENDVVTVGGQAFTFKANPVTITEVKIGSSAAESAVNLADTLGRSSIAAVQRADYTVSGNVVTVSYGVQGVVGNSFTLASGTPDVAVSGAQLSGGSDMTSGKVQVPTGVGIDIFDFAKELVLHPKSRADNDLVDDFTVFKAGTAGAITFAFKLDEERIFNVEFTGYPDLEQGERLFAIGDRTAS